MTRLQQLRLNARLTRAELAKDAKVSETTINQLEARKIKDPRTATLIRIADCLDAQPGDLMLDAVVEIAEAA